MISMYLALYIQQPINDISHVFIFIYLITHCRYFDNSLPIFSMCSAPYVITDYIYFSSMILRGQWDSDFPAEAFKMQTKKGLYSARIWSDPSQWRHNEHFGVSNHQPHHCLLSRLFKAQIRENIKALRRWPLCREFTGDRWIPRTKDQ